MLLEVDGGGQGKKALGPLRRILGAQCTCTLEIADGALFRSVRCTVLSHRAGKIELSDVASGSSQRVPGADQDAGTLEFGLKKFFSPLYGSSSCVPARMLMRTL